MGRITGMLIALGIMLGIYVGATYNAFLGFLVGAGIAIGAPALLWLLFNKIDDVSENIAEKKIRQKREERRNKWQE